MVDVEDDYLEDLDDDLDVEDEEFDKLKKENQALKNKYNELVKRYNGMLQRYNDLKNVSLNKPATKLYGRQKISQSRKQEHSALNPDVSHALHEWLSDKSEFLSKNMQQELQQRDFSRSSIFDALKQKLTSGEVQRLKRGLYRVRS